MTSWTNATASAWISATGSTWTPAPASTPRDADLWRATVRPERVDAGVTRHARPAPAPADTWVDQVWSLEWSSPVASTTATVIPHPAGHLTVESGPVGEVRHGHRLPATLLHGVGDGRFAPELPAGGWVVGLHLAPGSLRDLTGIPAHLLTGRVIRWDDLDDGCMLAGWDLEPVWAAQGPDARADALAKLATQHLTREPSPEGIIGREAERIARTAPEVRSVSDLAERLDVPIRRLQRVCREHVGVSPGWLLRRARLLEANALITRTDLTLAEVADRTGYVDQAHLTREYTAIAGVPPGRRRREG